MSSFEFTKSSNWGGRPVAWKIADAQARGRVVVSGTIVSVGSKVVGGSPSFTCVIDDGTGQLDLLFVGRRHVRELVVGARYTVEGTAQRVSSHLVVWNPFYRLDEALPTNPPYSH